MNLYLTNTVIKKNRLLKKSRKTKQKKANRARVEKQKSSYQKGRRQRDRYWQICKKSAETNKSN